jgi:hypothetical protein
VTAFKEKVPIGIEQVIGLSTRRTQGVGVWAGLFWARPAELETIKIADNATVILKILPEGSTVILLELVSVRGINPGRLVHAGLP